MGAVIPTRGPMLAELVAERLRARAATPTVHPHRWDPVAWAETIGVELWSKQREVLQALVEHRQVAVHACHSSSKTWSAALAVEWWVQTRTAGEARAVSTAPTNRQVRALLWGEIRKLHAAAKLPGRTNQTELHLTTGTGVELMAAFGSKPADTDTSAFQGVHAAEGVLLVGDEACGLDAALIDDAEKNLTGPDDRLLLIGNPDDSSAAFARICRGEIPGWHVIHIDAHDTPNWTGEPVSERLRRSLISREWAALQAAKYGETSPTYLARVRGLFSADSTEVVVSLARLARVRDPLPDLATGATVRLGVDVGAGSDWTVVQERVGARAGRSWRLQSADPLETAEFVLGCIVETGAVSVCVDAIGVGWGLAGTLAGWQAEGRHHAAVHRVNVAEASTELDAHGRPRFVNLRSQLWWQARERCDGQAWDLSALGQDAAEQLTWPRWSAQHGKIRVEPKETTIERHGHSPDDADALLLAWYEPAATVPKRRLLRYTP